MAMQNGKVDAKLPAVFTESRERKVVWLLCLLAAIHVFVFSAAFPFFNNVDEPDHFDSVLEYSHGRVPRGDIPTSREASVYLALFCSCAYLGPTGGGPIPPPPWTQTPEQMKQALALNSAGWQTQTDYEASEPPLYYALAGVWWDIGKGLGFAGGHLLYWIRFLNVVLIVPLVWLAYIAAKTIFPENSFIHLATPAFAAFMPQSAFYSIGNDILSPLCFGLLFICIIKWLRSEDPSAWGGAAMGLAFAVTYLSKTTNLPLLAIVAVVILLKITQKPRAFKKALPAMAAFFGCAVPPIIAWMIWCKLYYGDFTGSKLKMEHFGWTIKPFGQWWSHPLFSPAGFWTYLSGQLATFWQGEFEWYYPPLAKPLALPFTDTIYTIFSLALIVVALPGIFPRRNPNSFQRHALQLSLACFAATLAFFALASIVYDFHNCVNPSRAHPFFHAGRMLLGALIPFLVLIVYGLSRALNRFEMTTKWAALATIILAMLVVEITTNWLVFSNQYNWFHLP